MEQPNISSRGPDDSAGSGLASEAWVRSWFEDHYKAGDVFYDGPEALTIKAAVEFASAAMASERERWQAAVRTVLEDWNQWDDVTAYEIQRLALKSASFEAKGQE